MNYLIISILLGVIILVMAAVAISHKESLVAIIATGAVGLFASVLFLMLAAPDVAMTEAAIGSRVVQEMDDFLDNITDKSIISGTIDVALRYFIIANLLILSLLFKSC